MKLEINIKKRHVYFLSMLIVLTGGILFVQGQGISNYGHDSDDVIVTVNGVEKSLKNAINNNDILTSDDVANGIGMNQAWIDLKNSRTLDTTYTNGGNKPIMVSVTTWNPDPHVNGCQISFYVDGNLVAKNSNNNDRFSKTCSVSIIVPPGSDYKVTSNPYRGYGGITSWSELK